jgi:serine/threonine-protein kinase
VPDVTGLTVAQAGDALQGVGLRLGEATEENSDRVPRGNIIDQTPEAANELEEGSAVDVTVSAGVAETTVPSLVGLSLDEARQALREADLDLGDTTPAPSEDPRGTVTKVDPKEGETVPVGSKVDLRYANGSNRVPDVVGRTAGEARTLLEQAGFSVPQETTRETDRAEPGTVISQSPGAKESRRLGSTVTFVVAAEPPAPTPTPSPTPTESSLPTETVVP